MPTAKSKSEPGHEQKQKRGLSFSGDGIGPRKAPFLCSQTFPDMIRTIYGQETSKNQATPRLESRSSRAYEKACEILAGPSIQEHFYLQRQTFPGQSLVR